MDRQTLVYEDPYQQIFEVDAKINGSDRKYFVTDTGNRAGVVVVRDGDVLLVKQHRLLVEGLSLEIPGGQVEPGETPEVAAVRECFEETGVNCINLRPLVFYHLGLDMVYNPTHVFYSEEIAKSPEPDDVHTHEVSGTEWVPLDHCIQLIFEGRILDSFSVVALLAYQAILIRRS